MESNHPTTVKDFFKRRLIICGIVLLIGVVLFLSAMQITSAMIFGDEAMSTYIDYTLSPVSYTHLSGKKKVRYEKL